MFKTILLCTDGSAVSENATRYAIALAAKTQARILALHVTDIRILEGPLLTDISGALGAQPYSALLTEVRKIQATKASAILEHTADLCRKGGVACETSYKTGGLTFTMLEAEAGADLVVLGQRGEHAQFHPEALGSSVESIVRASTKPCVVVPETFREPRQLLIAHDGSEESTRALYRGLDLAAVLGASVTIMTAPPDGGEEEGKLILEQASTLAQTRKLTIETRLADGNPETAILRVADETKADLIVMGAYGHTRIREWMLGSTTTQVLRKTKVPVYLSRGS